MTYFLILLSYCIGSIPFGLILTKFSSGLDIRTVGSGNIGTTNVLRSGHKYLAILTLLLDGVKSGVTLLLDHFISPFSSFEKDLILVGSAVIGHLFPIFLRFKGGKGIATLFGSLLILAPKIALISYLIWIFVALFTRYSSLAALIVILFLPLYGYYLAGHFFLIWALILGSLIIYKHKDNIVRLYQGKESRIYGNF